MYNEHSLKKPAMNVQYNENSLEKLAQNVQWTLPKKLALIVQWTLPPKKLAMNVRRTTNKEQEQET